jgi:hypothetical protein
MKSTIVFISLCATLFLSACGPDYYDRVIHNQSSQQVTYVHDGKTETLEKGKSRTYSVTLAVHEPSSIKPVSGHPKSIAVETDGFTYTIEDAPAFPVKVTNKLDRIATLHEAGGYMDAIENIPVYSESESSNVKTSTVYTETPVFTVTNTGNPARVVEEIKPDADNENKRTFFVVICEYE